MRTAPDDLTPPETPAEIGRRLGRFDLAMPVQLATRDGTSQAVIRNVSTGGMFVAAPCVLAVGRRVLVQLPILDKSDPLEIHAEVCWSRAVPESAQRPAGMGLRFTEPPLQAAIFVRVLLRRRSAAWA